MKLGKLPLTKNGKRMLTNLRKNSPEQGLALLQTELKNESAAHRDELFSVCGGG